MDIWEYHLVRIAGLSFNTLDGLNLDKTVCLIQEIVEKEGKMAEAAPLLADELHGIVQAAGENRDLSRRSLNLRRDIFNKRNLKRGDFDAIGHLLSNELHSRMEEQFSLEGELASLRVELSRVLDRERRDARKSLRKTLDSHNFKAGLLLGSETLYDSLSQYLRRQSPDDENWEGEELGFIKYLTRAAAKTSPFSSFTSLAMLSHSKNLKNTRARVLPARKSFTRLNNRILKVYLNVLFQYYPFYRHVRLRLNYTVYNDPNRYTFILNTNINNSEAFQAVPKQPILEYIFKLFEKRASVKYCDLITHLENIVSSSAADLQGFVDSLLACGFLEYEPVVSGMDPDWCGALISFLEKRIGIEEDEPLRELYCSLKDLESKHRSYADADLAIRSSILDGIVELIYDGYISFHKAVGLPEEQRTAMDQFRKYNKVQNHIASNLGDNSKDEEGKTRVMETTLFVDKRSVLFEDTSSPEELDLDIGGIEDTISVIDQVNRNLHFANIFEDSRERIRTFFLKKYDKVSNVSCLEFYRAFSENKRSKEVNTFANQGYRLREQWIRLFSTLLQERGMNGDCVEITVEDIANVNEQLGITSDSHVRRSYAAFFQTARDSVAGEKLSVVNGVMVGYGKFASRFLELFDDKLTDYFRKKNRELMQECIFVEHNDASYFNANIHPPLLAKELITTGNHPVMGAKKYIKIQNIEVCYSEEDDEMYLRDRVSGKRVVVFDIGFQSPVTRSAFFNFLSTFTHSSVPDYGLIVSAFYDAYERLTLGAREWTDELMMYPRLCIRDNIVLTRRRWRIHPNHFPVCSKDDDFVKKMKAIWEWKINNRIPEEFFLTYSPEVLNGVSLSRKDGKPQYINLRNPFLIRLFWKYISRGTTLSIEEMLPAADALHSNDRGERFVSEMLVHWNS